MQSEAGQHMDDVHVYSIYSQTQVYKIFDLLSQISLYRGL